MAHKQFMFKSVAREKVLKGAGALAAAVRVTLGCRCSSGWRRRRGLCW